MKIPSLEDGDLQPKWIYETTSELAHRGTSVLTTVTRTLVARSSYSSTCLPGNNSPACEKPVDTTNSETLPVVLGVVIPISAAIIVFIFLHRRNKKKQNLEDINDPHKSLDFGLGLSAPPRAANKPRLGGLRGKRDDPEMIVTDFGKLPIRPGHDRGLSMDMLGSPYMLPAGLSGSRESLHSMTRSARDEHDPYRPVVFPRASSDTSRSPRPFHENASMYSASTTNTGFNDRANLVPNAQRMSQSYPSRSASFSQPEPPTVEKSSPLAALPLDVLPLPQSRKASAASSEPKLPDISVAQIDLSANSPQEPDEKVEDDIPSFPFPAELPADSHHPPRTSSVYTSAPPRKSSIAPVPELSVNRPLSDASYYGEDTPPPMPPPKEDYMEPQYHAIHEAPEVYHAYNGHAHDAPDVRDDGDIGYDIDPSMIYTGRYSMDGASPPPNHAMQNNRLSYMGMRPLPPENPEENAEQRANRIRSFYKEYFDVNRPNPTNAYYEDFDADYTDNYYGDGWYDPETGAYYEAPQAPYAQPVGRRAMTPPPRAGPRFAGAHDRAHDRHYSTLSAGRGPFRGRAPPPPKKKLPPPKPLTSLPTPHMLKTDSALLNGIDFAPPTSFRGLQNGRGRDSPTGTARPYSPSVRAFSPLVGASDILSPIPSPHQLRKSSTFTSLDFSPQVPRFLGREGAGSDAGSIRSAKSGISALQLDAVRSGAYRVSRIPKEFVTSREDLSKQLRPKMDLTSYA